VASPAHLTTPKSGKAGVTIIAAQRQHAIKSGIDTTVKYRMRRHIVTALE